MQHTSQPLPGHASHQTIKPIDMRLRLANRNRMTLLEDFVYRNEGLESLHFVCKDRLSAQYSVVSLSLHHHLHRGEKEDEHFHTRPKGG